MSNHAATARLLMDPPRSGAWNMAVDHALLETVSESGGIVLRFYQWAEPTLSLGYFQKLASRAEHPSSRDAIVVRRASGGGAILHDRELTYSLTVPADFSLKQVHSASDAASLYRAVHDSLIAALADLGVAARLCLHEAGAVTGSPPFMCFARRCVGDVLFEQEKIAGSAQRRYRKAVLQHGSILLSASPAAPELAGIAELAATVSVDQLVEVWLPQLTATLGLACRPAELTKAELGRAQQIQRERYESVAWTALK